MCLKRLFTLGFVISLILFSSPYLRSQHYPNYDDSVFRGSYGLSIGYNSFKGVSIGMEYALKYKKNNFGVLIQLNSEINQKTQGYLTPVFYNDKFYEIALYYGRLIQVKRVLFEADLGPSLYLYKDKSLAFSGGFLSTAYSKSSRSSGVGLHGKFAIDYFLSKQILLGIYAGGNLNSDFIIFHSGLRLTALF